ncbi:oxidoreductase [Labedella endophytica]|uniref:Oxidoreductase n=2 Tax=Labedella endophytica TaxID=1523160 RepID=A0A433JQE9_9MICO|nr:oxidoreductase [Labedella endophytica]
MVRESTDIVSIELAGPRGEPLPPWEPGAHIDVQLVTRQQRQYSLCGDPADRSTYRIAVLREEFSRGASMYVHDYLRVGRTVHAGTPRNLFPLLSSERYLLLAAGIGITPILPMARALAERGAHWSLNYAVRDGAQFPFQAELDALGDRVTVNAPDRAGRLDLAQFLAEPRPGTAVYCCGPARFTDAVEEAMAAWPRGGLHLERFEPKIGVTRPNEPFTVRCVRSEVTVDVPAELSMLKALEIAGVAVPGSCLRGVCGSCAVTVLGGEPEHRDSLTSDEHSATMYPCVSRSLTPSLEIDV